MLFGYHGGPVNVTDGRYVYMRAAAGDNTPLYEYTLMPTHMATLFDVKRIATMGTRAALFLHQRLSDDEDSRTRRAHCLDRA